MTKPRLSPAQRRVVDAMREGADLEYHEAAGHWYIGWRHPTETTALSLVALDIVKRYEYFDKVEYYRLAPEWQAEQ